jgi:hypothetical protein
MAADSWQVELAELLEEMRLRRPPRSGVAGAQAALRAVETLYMGGGS